MYNYMNQGAAPIPLFQNGIFYVKIVRNNKVTTVVKELRLHESCFYNEWFNLSCPEEICLACDSRDMNS